MPNKQNIDLEKTFQFIGDGFSYIFNAIGSFFKTLLHYLILGLSFLRKNFLVLAIATVIGAVYGYISEQANPTQTSEMILETNFGSGHRLYKQIDLLNTLIEKQDSIQLGKIFHLKPSETTKFISFEVSPYQEENHSRIEYDYYMQNTDTIFTKDFEFSDFKKRVSSPDYRWQSVLIKTQEDVVFTNLQKGIFDLVINERLQEIYAIKKQELKKRKEIINTELNAVDTLRKHYSKAELLAVSNNQNSSSTNINLRENKSTINKDIDLFTAKKLLLLELTKLNKEIVRFDFILNVVSDFTYSKSSVLDTKEWVKYGVYGFLLSLLVLLGFKLNTFVANYQTTK